MIYLLDTDLVIFMARGRKPLRPLFERDRADLIVKRCRAAQDQGDSIGLSVITACELEFGARSSGQYPLESAAVHKVLAPFRVYDYESVACVPHYGRIRHELKLTGTAIGALDMLIAAHAVALGATLVTNNLAHFSRVQGLQTENWAAS